MKNTHVLLTAALCASCGEQTGTELLDGVNRDAEGIEGGTILSSSQAHRSGIVELISSSYSGNHTCTGAVLSSSASKKYTWVLTAGHCHEDYPDFDTAHMYDPTTGEYHQGHSVAGQVYRPSAFSVVEHDIALVRFPFGITVGTNGGPDLHEYFRPILQYAPSGGNEPFGVFGAGTVENTQPNVFCQYGKPVNDDTLRWAHGEFDIGGDDVISSDSLDPEPSYIGPGDSGGPWIVTGYSPILTSLLNDGVIAGVLSNATCLAGATSWHAASTWNTYNKSYINSVAEGVVLANQGWTRTCWKDWCHYDQALQSALLVASIF